MNPGVHAAIAAAEKKKQEKEEEERLTHYSTAELNEDWEFKIVRSEMSRFKKPEKFQQLMAEEAQSGWKLVEKIDNKRVRFKRLRDARIYDEMLLQDIDPYRINFDQSNNAMGKIIGIGIIVLILSIGLYLGLT